VLSFLSHRVQQDHILDIIVADGYIMGHLFYKVLLSASPRSRQPAAAHLLLAGRRRALSVAGSATARTLTPVSTACIEAIIAVARYPSPITASLVTPLDQTPIAAAA
jgi:hypothetical protein